MNYPQASSGTSYRLLGIAFLLVVSLVFFFVRSNAEAIVTIHSPDGDRAFEGKVTRDMTVLDALVVASSVGKFEFNYTLKDSVVHINRFGNFVDGLDSKIRIELNGKDFKYDESANKKISPGDKIDVFIN